MNEIVLVRTLEILKQLSNLKLNSIDWHIIKKLLLRNIKKSEQSIIMIHEKKLRNSTRNTSNPFTMKKLSKIFHLKICHLKN